MLSAAKNGQRELTIRFIEIHGELLTGLMTYSDRSAIAELRFNLSRLDLCHVSSSPDCPGDELSQMIRLL
jgi:hypothetical protein